MDTTTDRQELEAEIQLALARQQEVQESIADDRAVADAIRASRIYRLSRLVRRIVPRPEPVLTEPPVARLTARPSIVSDDPLAETLERELATLARLEAEARRVHHELYHLQLSRPRRIWMTVRRRAHFVRHPVWTLAAAGRVIGNRGAVRSVRLAWRHFRSNALLLRSVPPATQQTNQPQPADAIRWVAPARISGRTEHALLLHPSSSVTFNLHLPARARVVADCALLPVVWSDNRGGVPVPAACDNVAACALRHSTRSTTPTVAGSRTFATSSGSGSSAQSPTASSLTWRPDGCSTPAARWGFSSKPCAIAASRPAASISRITRSSACTSPSGRSAAPVRSPATWAVTTT
jgi:hypothetical protein